MEDMENRKADVGIRRLGDREMGKTRKTKG